MTPDGKYEPGYSHTGVPPLNRDPFHKHGSDGQSAAATRVDRKQSAMAFFVYGHGQMQGSHESMDEHGTHRRGCGGRMAGEGEASAESLRVRFQQSETHLQNETRLQNETHLQNINICLMSQVSYIVSHSSNCFLAAQC